jgi:hypothetical protein
VRGSGWWIQRGVPDSGAEGGGRRQSDGSLKDGVAHEDGTSLDTELVEGGNCTGSTPHVLYPFDSGVIDVAAYGTKGDGVTDDTDALQAAISANLGGIDGGNPQSHEGVPALENVSSQGLVGLVTARLTGGTAASAIVNAGGFYGRDITTSGYGAALSDDAGVVAMGPGVTELALPKSFEQPPDAGSLRLPIAETPELPYGDPSTWVSVESFGVVPNLAPPADQSSGIEMALNSTASTAPVLDHHPIRGCSSPSWSRASGRCDLRRGVGDSSGISTARSSARWPRRASCPSPRSTRRRSSK